MFKKALIIVLILVSIVSLSAQRRQVIEFSVPFTYDIPPVHSMNFDPTPIHFQLNHVPGNPELYMPAFQSSHYILSSTTANATMRARLVNPLPVNVDLVILESSSPPPGATFHPVSLDTTPRIVFSGMNAVHEQPLNMDFEMRARTGARTGGGSGTIQFTISE